MYRDVMLGTVVRHDPKRAFTRIVNAYVATETEVGAAARLQIGVSTLKRWVVRLREDGLDVRREVARRRARCSGTRRSGVMVGA